MAHIGTNAIPTLLHLLRDPNSVDENVAAMRGFRILGGKASSAVPDLIRIYEERISGPSQYYTARSLGMIGPAAAAAAPLLLDSATNPAVADTNYRQDFAAVIALGQIHTDAETVVPVLASLVGSSNKGVAQVAVEALAAFGPSAKDAIPALLQAAANTSSVHRGRGFSRPVKSASDAINAIQAEQP